MDLKKTFIVTAILSIVAIGIWEYFWRSKGVYPTLDDNEALWAMQRYRVEKAPSYNMLLMGSSRVLFDIQLDEWEAEIGIRPIQLASVGSSPLPIFHDVVANTSFTGTIIVGVTPGLFFSTTSPDAQPWQWPQSKVDYYKKRTYAQISNHLLSLPLQKNLAFISDDQGIDGIKLKELVGKINIGNRVVDPMPPFHEFGEIAEDRNLKMKQITVTDTAYANSVIKVWQFFMKGAASGPPPDKNSTIDFFLNDLKVFEARGGQVILIRCPSSGSLRAGENMGIPRAAFWDDLVKQANVPSYHFEDYDNLKGLICPEESHLSAEDAQYFTTELVKIMKNDNTLINLKSNKHAL
ncbi:hypothetical protein SAMN06265371_101444 [Lutibacter agarilyticus]|uniref:Uncharacterized protein n=1 Tax=Lutibacter agarilyticus TaxID=1109740 RepID=A0A238VHB1_9FLAO|nr:hypothetical protein [Lutibacter agarilyticus]SNR33785.1 hypothetical protein SAMN06265371_101444 [Lutibacter agarilyticus]